MKAITQYLEEYDMGKITLQEFMTTLACTHFDGIQGAIDDYFIDEGYFESREEGLDYYDNN